MGLWHLIFFLIAPFITRLLFPIFQRWALTQDVSRIPSLVGIHLSKASHQSSRKAQSIFLSLSLSLAGPFKPFMKKRVPSSTVQFLISPIPEPCTKSLVKNRNADTFPGRTPPYNPWTAFSIATLSRLWLIYLLKIINKLTFRPICLEKFKDFLSDRILNLKF